MNALQWLNAVIVALGIPTIVTVLILIGRKLQILDTLRDEVDKNIRPDLKDVRERFATLEGKNAGLYMSQSPISLTPTGSTYLEESGLREYIDTHKEELMKACDHDKTMQTPYDVQEVAFSFLDAYNFPQAVEDKVKTFAFDHGISMDSMRRIAAIHFRDLCLDAHGFKSEELDK